MSARFVSTVFFLFTQELCGDFFDHKPVIQCYPAPDAFNPCEDVMGNYYLRCIVWLVVVAAVLGNAAVIVVLVR